MAAETIEITQRKPVDELSDRELLKETTEQLRHLRATLDTYAPLLEGLSRGGLLAYRKARRG